MIDFKYTEEQREKTAFYSSDYGKMECDLYWSFVGEPKTNPPVWSDTLKWGAGIGVEDKMVEILKMNKVVDPDYDQKEHGRVDFKSNGVEIHGYADAITSEDCPKEFHAGCPIEIKSINNKNSFDIRNYENNQPRESYVGQLASYMKAMDKDKGYLFVASIDGLNTFWIECDKIGEDQYKCGMVLVNLNREYDRWAELYKKVLAKEEPECTIRYKVPVSEVDWHSVSKGDISKARNNHKVIGDPDAWLITYSSWKDKILEQQGVTAGYSQKEIEYILEATQGYTTWDKK